MPVKPTGSTYKVKGGFGIRWTQNGKRHHQSPFHSAPEARAWWLEHIAPNLNNNALHDSCASMREWARLPSHAPDIKDSWVYVIAAPDLQRIKIGRSVAPSRRLRDHATSSPMPLTVLLMVPGGIKMETALLKHTKAFACPGAGREWRTMEALSVVIALIRERAGDRRANLLSAR